MQEWTPSVETTQMSMQDLGDERVVPRTPVRSISSKASLKEVYSTPRLRKKLPWRGKNIMILLPRDDERGRPGKSPMPLNQKDVERMFVSWEELGYGIAGFDLEGHASSEHSRPPAQSREVWPGLEDLAREFTERRFKVTLPDLNGT
jgi:hypothetical protein